MNSFYLPMRNPTKEAPIKPEYVYIPTDDADDADYANFQADTWEEVTVVWAWSPLSLSPASKSQECSWFQVSGAMSTNSEAKRALYYKARFALS